MNNTKSNSDSNANLRGIRDVLRLQKSFDDVLTVSEGHDDFLSNTQCLNLKT